MPNNPIINLNFTTMEQSINYPAWKSATNKQWFVNPADYFSYVFIY
jgi:hypothetical protein